MKEKKTLVVKSQPVGIILTHPQDGTVNQKNNFSDALGCRILMDLRALYLTEPKIKKTIAEQKKQRSPSFFCNKRESHLQSTISSESLKHPGFILSHAGQQSSRAGWMRRWLMSPNQLQSWDLPFSSLKSNTVSITSLQRKKMKFFSILHLRPQCQPQDLPRRKTWSLASEYVCTAHWGHTT